MPSNNIPGQFWAIRISRLFEEVRLALDKIPGVYIGEHPADSGCSRTHYHIYYTDTKVRGHDNFIKFFKKTYNLEALKGNKDFAVSMPTSLLDWFQYVYGGPSEDSANVLLDGVMSRPWRMANVIMSNGPLLYPLYPINFQEIPILPHPTDTELAQLQEMTVQHVTLKDSQKKEPCYIRFWRYCLKEIGDRDYGSRGELLEEIGDAWIDWTDGAYELRNVSAPIRYVLVQLERRKNDGDIPMSLRLALRSKLLSQV